MPGWADHAATMDAQVDARLGDTISYSRQGEAFGNVQGFVILAGTQAPYGIAAIDQLSEKDRVQLNDSIFGKPVDADRLSHPKLGAFVFKPANVIASVQGRAWIFELQKVGAL